MIEAGPRAWLFHTEVPVKEDTVRVLMLGDVSGSAGMSALFVGLSSLVRDLLKDIHGLPDCFI